jgi:hypothetical protein
VLNVESSPDLSSMQIILNEETCIDHRTAASLALQLHWTGETEKALVWERLSIFLRASEAYIFDDVSCCSSA